MSSVTNTNTEQKNNTNIDNITSIHPLQLKKTQLEQRNLELKNENEKLNEKLENLKKNVLDLKEHVDKVIYNQLDLKTKNISDLKLQLEVSNNKIYSLNKQLDNFDSISETQKEIRQKYFSLINEKIKNENFYLTQEEIIKELKEKNISLKRKRDKINEEFKKVDEEYSEVYNNVQIDKKIIINLQNDLARKIEKSKLSINILNEKSIEISNLRNKLNILKSENEQKLLNKQKGLKLKNVNSTNKLNISKVNNSKLNNSNLINNESSASILAKQNQKFTEANSLMNIDQSNLNENEPNYMKELTGYVNEILNE